MTEEETLKDLEAAEKALHDAKDEIDDAEKALERAKVELRHGSSTSGPEPASAPASEPEAEESAPQPDRARPPAPAVAPERAAEPEQKTGEQHEAPAPAQVSSGKWRVEFVREECIGAGACVAANADYWSIDDDGKAVLKSAVFDESKKVWVLELDDEQQLQKQRDAAGVCPVNVIHIIDPNGNQEI